MALGLIGRELDSMVKDTEQGRLDHESAQDLCRFFSVLQSHEKNKKKTEDELRKKLAKKSAAELKKIAGMKDHA